MGEGARALGRLQLRGLSQAQVDAGRHQDLKFQELKIPRGMPTFCVDGAMIEDEPSFEEVEKKIKPLLKS
jgi:hypothetical protein